MNQEQLKQTLRKISAALGQKNANQVTAELAHLTERLGPKTMPSFIKFSGVGTVISAMEAFPNDPSVLVSGCRLLAAVITSGNEQGISAILAQNRGTSAVAWAFVSFPQNSVIESAGLRVLATAAWRVPEAFSMSSPTATPGCDVVSVVPAVPGTVLGQMCMGERREGPTAGLRWAVLGGASRNPEVRAALYDAFGVKGVMNVVAGLGATSAENERWCAVGCLGVLSAFVEDPGTRSKALIEGALGAVVCLMKKCRGDLAALSCGCKALSATAVSGGWRALTAVKAAEEVVGWVHLYAKGKIVKGLIMCCDTLTKMLRYCDPEGLLPILQAGTVEALFETAEVAAAVGQQQQQQQQQQAANDVAIECMHTVCFALEKAHDKHCKVPTAVVGFLKTRGIDIVMAQTSRGGLSSLGIELIACLTEFPELASALVRCGAHKALAAAIPQVQDDDRIVSYACIALGRIASDYRGGRIADARTITAVAGAIKHNNSANGDVMHTACYAMATLLNDAHSDMYKIAVSQGILDIAVGALRDPTASLSSYLYPCCIVKSCAHASLATSDAISPPDYIGRIVKLGGIPAMVNILHRTLSAGIDSNSIVWENPEAWRAQVNVLDIMGLIVRCRRHPEAAEMLVKADGLSLIRTILITAAAYEVQCASRSKEIKPDPDILNCILAGNISLGILRVIADKKPEYAVLVTRMFFPENPLRYDVKNEDEKDDEDENEEENEGEDKSEGLGAELGGENLIIRVLEQSCASNEPVLQECLALFVRCLDSKEMPMAYVEGNANTFIEIMKVHKENPEMLRLAILSVIPAIKAVSVRSLAAKSGCADTVINGLAEHQHDIKLHIAGIELLTGLFQCLDIKQKSLTQKSISIILGSLMRFADVEELQCVGSSLLKSIADSVSRSSELFTIGIRIALYALQNFIRNDTIRANSLCTLVSFGSNYKDTAHRLAQNVLEPVIMAMIRSIEVNPYKSPLVSVNATPPPSAKARRGYFGELVIADKFWFTPKTDEEKEEEARAWADDSAEVFAQRLVEDEKEEFEQAKGLNMLMLMLEPSTSHSFDSNEKDMLAKNLMKNSNHIRILQLAIYGLRQRPKSIKVVYYAIVTLSALFGLFPILHDEALIRYNVIGLVLNAMWKEKLYRGSPKTQCLGTQLIKAFLEYSEKGTSPAMSPEAKESMYNALLREGGVEYAIYSLENYSIHVPLPVSGDIIYALVNARPEMFCKVVVECGGIGVLRKQGKIMPTSYGAKRILCALLLIYMYDPCLAFNDIFRDNGLGEIIDRVRYESSSDVISLAISFLGDIIKRYVKRKSRNRFALRGGTSLSEVAFTLVLLGCSFKVNYSMAGTVMRMLCNVLELGDEEVYARLVTRPETYQVLTTAIRSAKAKTVYQVKTFAVLNMVISYLARKNMLWRLFQPYVDDDGKVCEYRYINTYVLAGTFQINIFSSVQDPSFYVSCVRLIDTFCSSPYYPLSQATKNDFTDSSVRNINNTITKFNSVTATKIHATSIMLNIGKVIPSYFSEPCFCNKQALNVVIQSLSKGLGSPLCVNYAFAAISVASMIGGDGIVKEAVSVAEDSSLNLLLLFMTGMSLYPSTFGIQACGAAFISMFISAFPDFVDKFLVESSRASPIAKSPVSPRLFTRLIQLLAQKIFARNIDGFRYAVHALTTLLTSSPELLSRDSLGFTAARRAARVLVLALKKFVDESNVIESILLSLLALASEFDSVCTRLVELGAHTAVARTMAAHCNSVNVQSAGVALLGLLPHPSSSSSGSNQLVKAALEKSAKVFKSDSFIYTTSASILKHYN